MLRVRPRRWGAWVLVGGLCLSGCASVPLRASYQGPQPLPLDVAADYSYPKQIHPPILQLLHQERAVHVWLVRFPLATTNFEPTEPVVEFEWFQSQGPGPRPAILLNPILGGDYPLERGLCWFFARQGFHVALVHRKTLKISPEHPISHVEVLLRQGMLRIRQTVDWMEQQEEVDTTRLGSFGISMGGIASVITAAIEPRLRCHVIALAGGSLPEILVRSHDPLLTKPRLRYLKQHQMSLSELETALREVVKTDPIRLAPYVDARRLFLIIALGDRTIGRRHALGLWHALGNPRASFLPLGHYTAYLALPYIKTASLRFFKEQLK